MELQPAAAASATPSVAPPEYSSLYPPPNAYPPAAPYAHPPPDAPPSPDHTDVKMAPHSRCLQCGKYFAKGSTDVCCFHPGNFISFTEEIGSRSNGFFGNAMAQQLRWSCCRREERDAMGCAREMHLEDSDTTRITGSYFVGAGTLSDDMGDGFDHLGNPVVGGDAPRRRVGGGFASELEPKFPCAAAPAAAAGRPVGGVAMAFSGVGCKPGATFIHHHLSATDTLQGISLRYGCSVDELKRVNRLWSEQALSAVSVLLVPFQGDGSLPLPSMEPTPEQLEAQKIQRFRALVGCSLVEARSYLSLSEGNFDEAVAEWKADVAFEKQNAHAMPASISSTASTSGAGSSGRISKLNGFSMPSAPRFGFRCGLIRC